MASKKDVYGIHRAAETARKEMRGESRVYEEQHFFDFVAGVFRANVDGLKALDAIYDEFRRIKKLPY